MTDLDLQERRKRRREWIAIGALVVLFIGLTVAELRLSRLSSTLPFVNSIFFFGLLNINLVILITVMWLVFRNIGKLFLERRRQVLGSRLKTKLVFAFLSFSIIPTLMLFVISATYINSSFDKWFSIKIQNTLRASLEITDSYYRIAGENAMHFADHLAGKIRERLKPKEQSGSEYFQRMPAWVEEYLSSQRDLLALDSIEYYHDPLDVRVITTRTAPDRPQSYPRPTLDLLNRAFAGERVSAIQHIGNGDLIRSLVPVQAEGAKEIAGVVVVSTYIPVSLVNKVDEIASVFDDYRDVNPLKYPMKTTYFVILVTITLVIIFVAIWIGLYLARELTVPVERLVHGAHAVGAGNLDVRIESQGHDEIATLVDSFNRMTQDLRDNRARLTEASDDLEKRRLQLEAVLANVGTGVLVVGRKGEITTFNRALSHLLQIEPSAALGRNYRDALGELLGPLVEIIEKALAARTMGEASSTLPEVAQWNLRVGEQSKALAAVATPLRDQATSDPWGVVLAIDDMTLLIKGQREMAWREVARRIAHEIKNPLTPIKLSAQRLQRRFGALEGPEGAVLRECTDTIIQHTDELKEMVNEFSSFARFPEASPAPHDFNQAVREVVSLYQQAHPEIELRCRFDSRLPIFDFDRDQMKRVVINLLDNAVAALSDLSPKSGISPLINLETAYLSELELASLSLRDNGPGMNEEVRARVFEPYFSTKSGGTGLGLAIAKRIVNDHDGFIRVHSGPGEGTLFTIELPTAKRTTVADHRSRLEG